jgi:hypothetical protein
VSERFWGHLWEKPRPRLSHSVAPHAGQP